MVEEVAKAKPESIHRGKLLWWLMVMTTATIATTLYMATTGKSDLPVMAQLVSTMLLVLATIAGVNLATVPGQGFKFSKDTYAH